VAENTAHGRSVLIGLSPAEPFALALLFAGVAVVAAMAAHSHHSKRPFSPAIVYLGLGVLAAVALALLGIAPLDPVADAELVKRLTELAVIVALFGAGVRIDRPLTWRAWRGVVVLLALIMPLTIALLTGVGLAGGLAAGTALLLAAALAPTDPVLAGELGVGPPGDEREPEPRFVLTAEAGMNDGLAFPFVLLGLVLLMDPSRSELLSWALIDLVYAVVAGGGMGALVGLVLGRAGLALRRRGLLDSSLDGWAAVAAVLIVYGATEVIGGYGFLAAFAGGLAFRRSDARDRYHEDVHHGSELLERWAELALIVLTGSMLTLDGLVAPGVTGWLIVLTLLAARPLMGLLLLPCDSLDARARLFVGWFGVRGIGSLYYLSVGLTAGVLSAGDARTVAWTAIMAVCVSIVLHGASSTPLARRLLDERSRRPEV
jgi:NhaP-type Na+/H+ or K+/H+ antiporter